MHLKPHYLFEFTEKKVLLFASVLMVLKDDTSASDTFDTVAEKYSQVINRLGQEFEIRFCDVDQLEPCVPFISNHFMNVDTTCNCSATKCNVQLGCWTVGNRNCDIAK